MKALVLDLETLDTTPTACVTSLSVLVFDPSVIKPFEELVKDAITIKLDWKEQMMLMNRTTSESTIEFWKKEENREAFNSCVAPSDKDVSVHELNNILFDYLNKMGYDSSESKAYSRGNAFDFSILENLYNQLGLQPLIPFWSYRDVRTEVDAIMQYIDENHKFDGYVNGYNIDGMVKHNSAHDCARDVIHMQYAHYQLGQLLGD